MKISSSALAMAGIIGILMPNLANAESIETQKKVEATTQDFHASIRAATEELVIGEVKTASADQAIETCGCDSSCDCGDGCGCGNRIGCGSACGLGEQGGILADLLQARSQIVVGGWTSFGYHNNNARQSFVDNDLFAYNDLPDRLNLHQTWLYYGREADGSNGFDVGWRIDAVYGTDSQKLQASGNPGAQGIETGTFDSSWDHGIYGWAMPQLYGEVAFGDWSIITGYFLTPIGYESSRAIDNFFYSHSLTMFNSEPFTHTGVLATYKGYEGLTLYSGWTLGWDTGFDQLGGSSAGIGGFSYDVNDFVTFTYLASAGDFGFRGDNAYNHSVVMEVTLTDNLDYAAQSDYVEGTDSFGIPGLDVEEYGLVQYLYWQLTDTWSVGGRAEWWKSNGPTGNAQSYYEVTGGLNWQPLPNVVFRPEVRYDWTPGETNFTNNVAPNYNQWVSSIDCVITY